MLWSRPPWRLCLSLVSFRPFLPRSLFSQLWVVRDLAEDGVCWGISMTPPPPLSYALSPRRSPADAPAKALPSSLILQILVATSAAHKQTPSWSLSLELTLCGHPLSYLRPISLADETWLYLCILYAGPQQCDMWCLVFCWLRRR